MFSASPKAALLVGINDYSAYDISLGRPEGTSNLRGALADVQAWYVVARRLGIPAENIEVRTSPLLSADDMPIDATGTHFGPATHDAILDGVQALGTRLGSGGPAQGLLTWSGHGASRAGHDGDDGALLCPSDVTGPALEQAISYATLQAAYAAHVPEHALTIVLDTCHAAPADSVGGLPQPTRFLGAPAASAAVPVSLPTVRGQDRMLAACAAGGTSQEYPFQGVWRGAFSWAATTILERWPTGEKNGARYIGIAYDELLQRAAALLEGAAFSQAPRFTGPQGDAAVQFGYPTGAAAAPGSERANEAGMREIDPGGTMGVYALRNLDGSGALGYVISVGAADVGVWKSGREYWAWSQPTGGFPAGGWSVYPYGTTVPTGVTPNDAVVYVNQPFPNQATQSQPTEPQTGAWFALDRGQGSGPTGFLNRNSARLLWYVFGNTSGKTPTWILFQGSPCLRFNPVVGAVPNPLLNVAMVSDAVTTP